MERENTSATKVFLFVCFLSPLQPAQHTEAAFLLSEKHKALSEIRVKVCLTQRGMHKSKKAEHKDHLFWSY